MVECRAVDLRDATPRQYADFVAGMDAIEVAVLNAGWVPDGTLADSDLMAFDEGFRTLLRPVLAGVLGLRNKLRAGRGRVVLMASVTATRPSSDLVVSSTMRTALRAFCEVAASDLARAGVTVNCICPGFVNTPGLAAWLARTAERAHVPTSTLREHCRKNVPLGRFADPAEIGALVAYLASAEAGYITGQTIVVDGGLILGTAIRHERSAVE
jgi:3-oxoacyl-[acyl-carrier protein] reductase